MNLILTLENFSILPSIIQNYNNRFIQRLIIFTDDSDANFYNNYPFFPDKTDKIIIKPYTTDINEIYQTVLDLYPNEIFLYAPSDVVFSFDILGLYRYPFLKTIKIGDVYIFKTNTPTFNFDFDTNYHLDITVIDSSTPPEPIIPIIPNPTFDANIAMIIHLYYQELWTEFKTYIDNVKSLPNKKVDLYITLVASASTVEDTNILEQTIKSTYTDANVYQITNKGLDVGAYLYCLNEIISGTISYDYFLKIHTEKTLSNGSQDILRQELINPICGNPATTQAAFSDISSNNNGMVGASKWITNYLGDNFSKVEEYKQQLSIYTQNSNYVYGSMFWVDADIHLKYITASNVLTLYNSLEDSPSNDKYIATNTNAFEKILGYMVTEENKLIKGR